MEQKIILIADDDPIILKLLEHDLTAAGYAVVQAQSGEAAIRLAKRIRPDLAILDIMMPGMDGGDVGQALKDDGATRHVPVIFLSSLVTKKDEVQEGPGTPDERILLAKPYDRDQLLGIIRSELYPGSPGDGRAALAAQTYS